MNRSAVLLLSLALVNGLTWMALLPPWQSPDEPKHFEYVRVIAETGRLVAFQTQDEVDDPDIQMDILGSMDAHDFWWYGRAPGYDPATRKAPSRLSDLWMFGAGTAFYRSSPAYYALAALFQPAGRLTGLYMARLLSVLFGVAVVGLTAVAAQTIAPDDPLVAMGAPAFVAFLPMFAQLHASVSSDALADLLAAFALLMALRIVMRGPGLASLVLLVIGASAAVAVKRTTVFVIPVAAMGLLAAVAVPRVSLRRLAGYAAGAGLGLAFVAATWFAAGGWDRLPQGLRWNLLRYFFNEPDQPARIAAYLRSRAAWPAMAGYVLGMGRSFWGSFGWQTLELPGLVYAAFLLLSIVAAAGTVRFMLRKGPPPRAKAALAILAAAPLLVALMAAAFFASYLFLPYAPAPQGRYLMTAILPVALLLTVGLSEWVPKGAEAAATATFVGGVLIFDLTALIAFVVPYFYT